MLISPEEGELPITPGQEQVLTLQQGQMVL